MAYCASHFQEEKKEGKNWSLAWIVVSLVIVLFQDAHIHEKLHQIEYVLADAESATRVVPHHHEVDSLRKKHSYDTPLKLDKGQIHLSITSARLKIFCRGC